MTEKRNVISGNLLIGICLIGFGVLFLLIELLQLNFWRYFWPFFVILPGILFFMVVLSGWRSVSGFAVPASIVTAVGLLLLYQNFTNHWQSWAYAWSLIFPTSLGLGLYIAGMRAGIESQRKTGLGLIKFGLLIFVIGGIFFELILGISDSTLGNILLPALIILLGGYLILSQMGILKSSGRKLEDLSASAEGGSDPSSQASEQHDAMSKDDTI